MRGSEGIKGCVWKLNTQGLTHVNQWTAFIPKTGDAPIDSLIQSGKEGKKTTTRQKSEHKTTEDTDWCTEIFNKIKFQDVTDVLKQDRKQASHLLIIHSPLQEWWSSVFRENAVLHQCISDSKLRVNWSHPPWSPPQRGRTTLIHMSHSDRGGKAFSADEYHMLLQTWPWCFKRFKMCLYRWNFSSLWMFDGQK